MTSMIDIVFLLLIFFMTVSQVSEANKERLELPKQQGSEEQVPTVLTINVTQDGTMHVAGGPVSLSGLVGIVDRELQRVDDDRSRLTLVIRADQRGTSQMPNEIIRTLGKMGINRVRIAVESDH